MILQQRPAIAMFQWFAPMLVAGIAILLLALLAEPKRQKYSAVLLAGAGAAYLSGGFGAWELVFCATMSVIAYMGLRDYRWIGVGWLFHTAADILHHLYGNPIIPFAPLSSFGCAICDVGLAAWYFAKAPSPYAALRAKKPQR